MGGSKLDLVEKTLHFVVSKLTPKDQGCQSNPIQSIHIWTIENPRLDNRLLGSQSNRNSQSIISSMFLDCFGLFLDCFGLFFGLFLDCF